MVSLERVRHAELKWDPVNHEPETMKRQTHRAPGLAERRSGRNRLLIGDEMRMKN